MQEKNFLDSEKEKKKIRGREISLEEENRSLRVNSQCRQINVAPKLATKERKNDLRRNSSIQKRLPIKAV